MESYKDFARVYDEFMDQTPYDEWLLNILNVFKEYKIKKAAQVLDLGCGTGKMSRRLAREGYQVTAVDNSMDMLEIAASEEDDHILYVLQDMVSLELPQQVDAAVSICDCMNYILEPEDLTEVFRLVNNYLDPGGVFIFDMNTAYKYEQLLGDHTFAESRQEGSFIWENYYDEETRINEYDLTLFIPEAGELYRRYAETHYQRNYKVEQIVDFLQQAGLVCEGMYDDYTDAGVKADSERITFVTRKE